MLDLSDARQKVSSVDKANVLSDIYGFWREILLMWQKHIQRSYDFNR